jgi:hypothetical protein
MLTIQNICLIKDIVGLPKDTLKDICTNSGLPTDGTVNDLALRIWEHIRENRVNQNNALENVKNRILAGKTAVTWYSSVVEGALRDAKQVIIESSPFNPFEEVVLPQIENLTKTPVLIGAASGDTESEYYLRFIYKSGVIRDYYRDVEARPVTKLCTVYVNEENGIVEVRSEPKVAKEIASSLFKLLRQRTFMEQYEVLAPYGDDVEKLADALEGEVIDTSSKPEESILEGFQTEQAEAIVDILTALDSYFSEQDIDSLRENLSKAQEIFGDNILNTPFTAIILAGLQKVSMGSDRELRGQPLYDFLRPYLQHQTGFIRFSFPENGVLQQYTIRVGLRTNSIFFVSPATENVIKYVREKIIL